jgi:3-oxoadipate enol-lactonase
MEKVSLGGGAKMAVEVRGSGSPTLLFVHGFPLNHSMWAAQMAEFSKRHRVIAPDLRGFGESDLGGLNKVSMDRCADDLAALLDGLEIKEKVVLCGLSMGGYLAFAFWRRHAGRLSGLVLADTKAGADAPEKAQGRLKQADQTMADGPEVMWKAMKGGLFAPDAETKTPEVFASVRAMMLGSSREAIAAALRGMAERPDSTGDLPRVSVPALAIVGAEDSLTPPADSRAIAAGIPGAELAIIPNAGHLSPMENPHAFNAALASFLAKKFPKA